MSFSGSASQAVAGVKSYAFNFGDGAKSTGMSPTVSHTYAKPGVHTATLTVTDLGGDSDTTKLTVALKQSCVVPHVTGDKLAAAKTALHAAGCAVGTIRRRRSSRPSGIVLAQTPVAGTKVPTGATVGLVVSSGP